MVSSVRRDVVRAGLVAVDGGIEQDMWMSYVFRERARSYKGFGFSSVFCGGWAGVIASRLAPTKILCGGRELGLAPRAYLF